LLGRDAMTTTPFALLDSTDLSTATGGKGSSGAAQLKLQHQLAEKAELASMTSNVLKTRHDTAKNIIGNIR
jgi:hypothetical protein